MFYSQPVLPLPQVPDSHFTVKPSLSLPYLLISHPIYLTLPQVHILHDLEPHILSLSPSILSSLPSPYSSPYIYPAVFSSQPSLTLPHVPDSYSPWPQAMRWFYCNPILCPLLYSSLFTLPVFLTLYLSCCVFFSTSVALASGSWLSMLSMSASHLTMLP